MYELTESNPNSAARHVTVVFDFDSHLSSDAIRTAVGRVMARHDALRMRFEVTDGELTGIVSAPSTEDVRSAVSVLDVGVTESEVQSRLLAPFRRASDPPIRVILWRRSGGDRLLIAVDHLVCDAWSLRLLLADLGSAYSGPLSGAAPQFVAWLLGQGADPGDTQRQVEFWRGRYAESPLAYHVNLPFGRPLDLHHLGSPAFFEMSLDAAEMLLLRQKAAAAKVSLFCFCLAYLNAIIAPYCDDAATAVSSAMANRWTKASAGIVGSLAHSASFVTRISAGASPIANLVRNTQLAVVDTMKNSRLALFDVLGRLGLGSALASKYGYGVYLDVVSRTAEEMNLSLGGAIGRRVELASGVSRSLSVWLVEHDNGGSLRANYERERFDDDGVAAFVRAYRDLLVSPDWTPARSLDDVWSMLAERLGTAGSSRA